MKSRYLKFGKICKLGCKSIKNCFSSCFGTNVVTKDLDESENEEDEIFDLESEDEFS